MAKRKNTGLMNYQKQELYRQRKLKASKANANKEKNLKKLKDRLRYLETSKMDQIKKKITDMKADIKKITNRKEKAYVRLNIKEITAKLKVLRAEQADLKANITKKIG